jgi:hypothetical protein
VDAEGILLEEALPARMDLPRVTGLDVSGGYVGQGRALSLVFELREAVVAAGLEWPAAAARLDLSDPEWPTAHFRGRVPVYLGLGGYREKLERLALVLPEVEEKGIPVKYIDLRFDQRVVVGTVEDSEPRREGQVREFG